MNTSLSTSDTGSLLNHLDNDLNFINLEDSEEEFEDRESMYTPTAGTITMQLPNSDALLADIQDTINGRLYDLEELAHLFEVDLKDVKNIYKHTRDHIETNKINQVALTRFSFLAAALAKHTEWNRSWACISLAVLGAVSPPVSLITSLVLAGTGVVTNAGVWLGWCIPSFILSLNLPMCMFAVVEDGCPAIQGQIDRCLYNPPGLIDLDNNKIIELMRHYASIENPSLANNASSRVLQLLPT